MTARRECLIRASGTKRCTPAEFLPSLPPFSPLFAFFLLRRCAQKAGKEREQGGTAKEVRTDGGRTMHNGRSSGRLKCNGGTAMRSYVGQRLALKLKSRAKRYEESKVRERVGGRIDEGGRGVRGCWLVI